MSAPRATLAPSGPPRAVLAPWHLAHLPACPIARGRLVVALRDVARRAGRLPLWEAIVEWALAVAVVQGAPDVEACAAETLGVTRYTVAAWRREHPQLMVSDTRVRNAARMREARR